MSKRKNRLNYIRNVDTRGLTIQEKQTLNEVLRNRNYGDDIERHNNSLPKIIEEANNEI